MQARERRNKQKHGHRRRAKQRKEAWARYESDLVEYNKRKSEQETEERRAVGRTHNSPYTKIRELAKELEVISHPNEEQERLR
jgi:CRISPR/Cas system-associated protein Cas10 (large subunit of type III CRISPR-Cas system)